MLPNFVLALIVIQGPLTASLDQRPINLHGFTSRIECENLAKTYVVPGYTEAFCYEGIPYKTR